MSGIPVKTRVITVENSMMCCILWLSVNRKKYLSPFFILIILFVSIYFFLRLNVAFGNSLLVKSRNMIPIKGSRVPPVRTINMVVK